MINAASRPGIPADAISSAPAAISEIYMRSSKKVFIKPL